MAGLLDQFRKKIATSVFKNAEGADPDREIDDLIALGVLLWAIAEADDKFLSREEEKIKDVLATYSDITEADMPIVIRAVREANINRIDLHSFTSEVGHNLSRSMKIHILENLFRVACVDKDLDEKEHELLRLVANLLRLDHQEFIETKIKIKKEAGMDTAGL